MRPLILWLFCIFVHVHSYKILVYNSKFGHSHSSFLGRIADIITDAGHNVTSLLPIINPAVGDGTSKSHKIHVEPDAVIKEIYENQQDMNFFDYSTNNLLFPIVAGTQFANDFGRTCKKVVEEPGLIERLRAEKYDVYINENFDVCGMGLAHAISPKAVIGSTSTFIYGLHFDDFGVQSALSYRPSVVVTSLDVHSIFSRLWNLYQDTCVRLSSGLMRRAVHGVLFEHFGTDYPTIEEQSSNVAFVLTNSESLIESAAPTATRVINIPGIGAKAPKPLDKYWEGVMSQRARTVLLSFGSVAKSTRMPEKSKRGILRAFKRFPNVTFIWKYEDLNDDFAIEAAKLNNLVLSTWVPQVDILNHLNLSLFITHGGMGSTMETSRSGVPALFIPIFFDQLRNAGMAEFNEVGRVYDKFDLHDDEKFAAMIRELLEDNKFRDNARRLSKMLAKKPTKSEETLIKHVEFAAEFGPSSALRPQRVDMTFIEYNNIDVIAFCLVISLLSLFAFFKIFVHFLTRLFISKKAKSE